MSAPAPAARPTTVGTDRIRCRLGRTTTARRVAFLGGVAYLVSSAAAIPQLGLAADVANVPSGV